MTWLRWLMGNPIGWLVFYLSILAVGATVAKLALVALRPDYRDHYSHNHKGKDNEPTYEVANVETRPSTQIPIVEERYQNGDSYQGNQKQESPCACLKHARILSRLFRRGQPHAKRTDSPAR